MSDKTHDLHDKRLADAWATLQAHSNEGLPLDRDPARLAFADPEFLLRRETRGIRMQLELMKPDLQMREHGIEDVSTVKAAYLEGDGEVTVIQYKSARKG